MDTVPFEKKVSFCCHFLQKFYHFEAIISRFPQPTAALVDEQRKLKYKQRINEDELHNMRNL